MNKEVSPLLMLMYSFNSFVKFLRASSIWRKTVNPETSNVYRNPQKQKSIAIVNLVDIGTDFLMFGIHSLIFYLILFKAIMLNSCSLLKQLFAYHCTKLNMHDASKDIFNSNSFSFPYSFYCELSV